jgi:aromatic ring-opening dioxygenase LigB subunit
MIIFACIAPHPPLLLPSVGSDEDRKQVKSTISALRTLGREIEEISPEIVVISSPHPDWGFEVPLHFLVKNKFAHIEPFLTKEDSPAEHFQAGRNFYNTELKNFNKKIALIASGDLSHRLKSDGPYGLHPDGTGFDKALVKGLKDKDIETVLKLDDIYPEAGECGLRSFSFLLGVLDAAKINWQFETLSYEGPFGVGYLVAKFKF